MTTTPPVDDDRELDRWVQEITDGWQQPRLRAGQTAWQGRVTRRPSGLLGRVRRPMRLSAAVGGVLGVAVVGVVTLAVVLSSVPPESRQSGATAIAGQSPSDATSPGPTALASLTPTPSATDTPPPQQSVRDDRFALSIHAGKTSYKADEPIAVSATLRYLGARQETVKGSGSGIVTFRIEDLDGPIDMDPGSTADCAPYVFHAGEVQQKPFFKSGGYSAEDPDAAFWMAFFRDPQLRLPHGRYRISANLSYYAPDCGLATGFELTTPLIITVE